MSERNDIQSPEQTFVIPTPDEARIIFDNFGAAGILKAYDMEMAEARVEERGSKLAIICPEKDPRNGREGKFINMLPPLNMARVVELFGTEEAVVEAVYRRLGYKGPIRFMWSPDKKEAKVQTSLADIVRTAPLGAKLAFGGLLLAVSLGVGKILDETPTGRAVQEFVKDIPEQVFGGEEK